MILWIIQWILISTLLISLIHYLYSFFENVLIIPKSKDLVNNHNNDNSMVVNDLFDKSSFNNSKSYSNTINDSINASNSIKASNTINASNSINSMESELEQFLQTIKSSQTNQVSIL